MAVDGVHKLDFSDHPSLSHTFGHGRRSLRLQWERYIRRTRQCLAVRQK